MTLPFFSNFVTRAATALAWLAAAPSHAAGGHHAVDDAAILDPGQCQIEAWADRQAGGSRSLAHVGPGCRVGPMEISLNLERSRARGGATEASAGPQLKWAGGIADGLSWGAAASTTLRDRSPHRLGGTLVLLGSWQPGATTSIHLNAGRDFLRGGEDGSRSGVAIEWMPSPAWSFVAERFRDGGVNAWRVGARCSLSAAWSADLSRAGGLHDQAAAWWTLGLSRVFQR